MSEKRNKALPQVKYLSYVHSSMHFCNGGALVEVRQGLDRIRFCHTRIDKHALDYDIMFDQEVLAHVSIDGCPSYSCLLRHGYGRSIMADEALSCIRDRINSGYNGIKAACEDIAPLLGLFSSGTYLVADMTMFPMEDREHFMDAPSYDSALHFAHMYIGGFVERNKAPLFLFPSQKPETLNAERVEHYRKCFREGKVAPRAIAVYLNGAVALLLDGHHKAVAAAMEGLPVHTLVIFPVKKTSVLKKHLEEKGKLYLHRANLETRLPIRDVRHNDLAWALSLESMDTEKITPPEIDDSEPWRLPDAFRPGPEVRYPNSGDIRAVLLLGPGEIRKTVEEIKTWPDDKLLRSDEIANLAAYARVFPDSKWLSPTERDWLEEQDKRVY